jgi:hypothetical protein
MPDCQESCICCYQAPTDESNAIVAALHCAINSLRVARDVEQYRHYLYKVAKYNARLYMLGYPPILYEYDHI